MLLNYTETCEGKYTWESRGQRSVIDFIMINDNLIKYYNSSKIDENKEILDLSDHNSITVIFNSKEKYNKPFQKRLWETS